MVSVQLHGSKKPITIVTPLGTDALPGLPTASATGTGSGKHIHLDREVGSCNWNRRSSQLLLSKGIAVWERAPCLEIPQQSDIACGEFSSCCC